MDPSSDRIAFLRRCYRDASTAADAAFTLMPQALPISFFVKSSVTEIPAFAQTLRRGSEIRSSQSDAMKTWPASPLSMARSVSFSPTTKADAFNSSNVMNLPLLLLSNFTQHWNYIITVMQCQQNNGAFLLYSCRTLLQRSRAYHLCVYPFLSGKE